MQPNTEFEIKPDLVACNLVSTGIGFGTKFKPIEDLSTDRASWNLLQLTTRGKAPNIKLKELTRLLEFYLERNPQAIMLIDNCPVQLPFKRTPIKIDYCFLTETNYALDAIYDTVGLSEELYSLNIVGAEKVLEFLTHNFPETDMQVTYYLIDNGILTKEGMIMVLPILNSSKKLIVEGETFSELFKIRNLNWKFVNLMVRLCSNSSDMQITLSTS